MEGCMKSDAIRGRLRLEDILHTVLRKKEHWLRKMEEMPEERLARQCTWSRCQERDKEGDRGQDGMVT